MTQEQKDKLRLHVYLHKPVSAGDDVIRFLNNNDIIEFTDCTNTSDNSEYIINNDSNRKIWYSQLSRMFMTDDLVPFFACIQFKSGEEVEYKDLDSCDLYNKCKGKRFKVQIPGLTYTFNEKSKIWGDTNIFNKFKMIQYIKDCINRDNIEKLGDILKTANAYFLIEI